MNYKGNMPYLTLALKGKLDDEKALILRYLEHESYFDALKGHGKAI